ncbi:DUF4190 domain-containing protein [Amycolatopsis sp. FDAARGOS 1241]|uniref:DUF4190 domain-containing protein n=1 Tax=Amycolatopsis sp. FDAARGOS 1241 TaxID=2778070 RepID=UPI001950C6CF|nr:DUF4190 domain-containing protein [Amycolatopsis sp. FDAARGOS 1241]QRP46928.1 DUF4190 domain-containing protein [Amycolatopsis sp. FDAARGOS 1241]
MSTPDNREQYQQYPAGQSEPFAAPPAGGGYGQPVVAPRNGFGVTALVLGILALVLCWTVWGGIVLGVLALVFGILGVKRANRREATNKGVAVSGIVTGSIGLVIGVILVVLVGSIFAMFGSQLSDLQDCLKQAGSDQSQVQQCEQQFSDGVQKR